MFTITRWFTGIQHMSRRKLTAIMKQQPLAKPLKKAVNQHPPFTSVSLHQGTVKLYTPMDISDYIGMIEAKFRRLFALFQIRQINKANAYMKITIYNYCKVCYVCLVQT